MIRRSLPRRTAAATAAAAGVVALAACGGNTPAQPVPTATPTPPSPAVQAVRDASAAFQAFVEDESWAVAADRLRHARAGERAARLAGLDLQPD